MKSQFMVKTFISSTAEEMDKKVNGWYEEVEKASWNFGFKPMHTSISLDGAVMAMFITIEYWEC